MNQRTASAPPRVWFSCLLILGAGLRIGLYLANRSLWGDEARLALNILHLGFRDLLGPLWFGQVAPPGFLLLLKAARQVLGTSELALRLVPLLCGLASMLLFFWLARRRLRPWAAPLACLLFAVAEPLIYYSTEVKQYSCDVFVTVVLWLLASWAGDEPARLRRWVVLGLAGAAAVFFSHTAVFVLGAVIAALVVGAGPKQARPPRAALVLVGCLWAAAFAIVYWFFLRRVSGDPRLVRYFTELFPGLPPAGVFAKARWVVGRLLGFFSFPGGLDHGGIPALCAIVGSVAVLRFDRRLLVTWTAPVGLALLAALAGFYPFEGRLVLFLVPVLYLLVAEGVEEIRTRTQPGLLVTAVLVPLLLYHPLGASWDGLAHPRYLEQLEPVLEHVSASRRPGDLVYVYYGSQYAARYYLETRRLSLADVPTSELLAPVGASFEQGWYAPALVSRPPSFFVGSGSRENWTAYGRQLDELPRVQRAWIVFSHVNVWLGVDERRLFLEHLDAIGARREAFERPGASAFLYDLHAR